MKRRMAALRGLIGHCVEIRRGADALARGNLLGPLPAEARGRRLWGAAYSDKGEFRVAAFDPLDDDLAVELAA